jgi:hypothetical protein
MESVPEKQAEDPNAEIDDDTIMQSQNQGMSLTKSLEEFMEQKNVVLFTDVVNLIFSVSLFLIYVTRTYFMCKFDEDPIWRMPKQDNGPLAISFLEENGYNYANETFTPSNFTLDEYYFPSKEC